MADIKLIGRNSSDGYATSINRTILLAKYIAEYNGVINSLYIQFNTEFNVYLGIYSDSSGSPDALLASVGPVSVVSGWNSIPITTLRIIKNSYYWIAAVGSGPGGVRRSNDTSGVMKAKSYTYGTLPNPAGSGYSAGTYSHDMAGYGTELAGCPRQAIHLRRLM